MPSFGDRPSNENINEDVVDLNSTAQVNLSIILQWYIGKGLPVPLRKNKPGSSVRYFHGVSTPPWPLWNSQRNATGHGVRDSCGPSALPLLCSTRHKSGGSIVRNFGS